MFLKRQYLVIVMVIQPPNEAMQRKINAALGWGKTIEDALKGGPTDPNEATFF